MNRTKTGIAFLLAAVPFYYLANIETRGCSGGTAHRCDPYVLGSSFASAVQNPVLFLVTGAVLFSVAYVLVSIVGFVLARRTTR